MSKLQYFREQKEKQRIIAKNKKIFKMTQAKLISFTANELKRFGYKNIKVTDSYVYAQGNNPIMLMAHLDTVHEQQPEIIITDGRRYWSPEGIGGDDRCGVIGILTILANTTERPQILFTTDEEIGCVGTSTFVKENPNVKANFGIEIDRRGYNQVVFYDCGNTDFIKMMTEVYEFDEQIGSFSDCKVIGEAYDFATANCSAGYWNEHTKTEYVDMNALFFTAIKIVAILETQKDKEFTHDTIKRYYNYYDYYKNNSKKSMEEEDFEYLDADTWFDFYGYQKPATIEDLRKILDEFDNYYEK